MICLEQVETKVTSNKKKLEEKRFIAEIYKQVMLGAMVQLSFIGVKEALAQGWHLSQVQLIFSSAELNLFFIQVLHKAGSS